MRAQRIATLWLGALVVVGALFGAGACDHYRLSPLDRQQVVVVPRKTDAATMEWAIESSLTRRRWSVLSHQGRRYIAQLQERGHSVDVAIDYDATGFSITYLRSKGLMHARYSDGTETIHRKYDTWVKNLSNDIRTRIADGPRARGVSRLPPPPPEPEVPDQPAQPILAKPPQAAPYDADGGVVPPAPEP